jgi:hypothetical protein
VEFLRVVEVFQPLFPSGSRRHIGLDANLAEFVREVGAIKGLCDLVLVGDHKGPGFLKFSAVQAAALLEGRAGVRSAPVIVARDANRLQLRSSILTAVGLGIRDIMLAWGDRYPAGGPANVYDYPSLAALISDAREIAEDAGEKVRLLAPVDLRSLGSPRGAAMAHARLRAGAELLLAQPPTTDSGRTLEAHGRLLVASGLKGRVLLNVFPFRGRDDLASCERFFGWSLPDEVHRAAGAGEEALTEEARRVTAGLRGRGYPGVYASTRGDPRVARRLLG